eukprot:3940110-Rhodomonas_salina.3
MANALHGVAMYSTPHSKRAARNGYHVARAWPHRVPGLGTLGSAQSDGVGCHDVVAAHAVSAPRIAAHSASRAKTCSAPPLSCFRLRTAPGISSPKPPQEKPRRTEMVQFVSAWHRVAMGARFTTAWIEILTCAQLAEHARIFWLGPVWAASTRCSTGHRMANASKHTIFDEEEDTMRIDLARIVADLKQQSYVRTARHKNGSSAAVCSDLAVVVNLLRGRHLVAGIPNLSTGYCTAPGRTTGIRKDSYHVVFRFAAGVGTSTSSAEGVPGVYAGTEKCRGWDKEEAGVKARGDLSVSLKGGDKEEQQEGNRFLAPGML